MVWRPCGSMDVRAVRRGVGSKVPADMLSRIVSSERRAMLGGGDAAVAAPDAAEGLVCGGMVVFVAVKSIVSFGMRLKGRGRILCV